MTSRRCVLDTNVLVSAALFKQSKPSKLVMDVYQNEILLMSDEVLEELANVLKRKKFNRYISQEDRELFLEVIVNRSVLIESQVKIEVCRDPKDNHILELATSGEADFIITGDQDLLVLTPFQDIQIVTPDVWLTNFRSR